MSVWYIILTIITLSALILIHELGHYLTARLFKVTVKEFAVGMGPKLVSVTSKKTGIAYSLRALPIGGYVAMVGEDEFSDDENALNRKPIWQRMIITAAGATMNILLGIVLMTLVVCLSANIGGTTIARFVENDSLSRNSGLEVGDEIVSVDGNKVHIASELAYEIMRNGIEPIEITVRRDGEIVKLDDVTFPTITQDGIMFGMTDFVVNAEPKTVVNVLKQAYFRSASTVKMIWETLIDLITGRYGLTAVSGPVGVTTAVSEAAASGIGDYLYLVVVIAMNLGIFNLLPFPALDGGRILFQIIEIIRRKPMKPELEGYIHFIGIAFLMVLMVLVTFSDLLKLFE